MLLALLLLLVGTALGCRTGRAPAAAEEVAAETRLHFGPRTELFVEIPTLIVGQPSRLAIHFTHLDGWKPVPAGRVSVDLGGERVVVEAPSSPGIYGATVIAATGGERKITISLDRDGVLERHDLGSVRVHATDIEARVAAQKVHEHGQEHGASIKLLMEQQWRMDFATAAATELPMRPSITLFGTLRGRAESDMTVRAPLAGQIVKSSPVFPRLGDPVKAGQILALLRPRFDATIDIGQLARDRARADASLAYARKERERQEQLAKEGLVSARDAELARRDEQIALAEVEAARRVMSMSTGGPAAAAGLPITAPFAGTLVAVDTAPTSVAERGGALFRVVDLSLLWVELRVPEGDRLRVAKPFGATLTVGEAKLEISADAFVALGSAIDPATRTSPLVYEVSAPGGGLALGGAVRAMVYTGAAVSAVAVPASAIVDDQGESVVYVQIDGEAFERRVVVPGARDGARVAVTGLFASERIVTVGAYAVKLASSSGAVPNHGHAH